MIPLGVLLSPMAFAQQYLFETNTGKELGMVTTEHTIVQYYEAKANTTEVLTLPAISSKDLRSDVLQFKIGEKVHSAQLLKKTVRDTEDFSWFGKLEEGSSIFFTVTDGSVASKFSIGDNAYTLVPSTNGKEQVLVMYSSTDVGICGNTEKESIAGTDIRSVPQQLNDNDCNLRVMMVYTTAAQTEVQGAGFSLATFAQVAVDEANMAYTRSNINITMELAIILRTGYVEVLGDFNSADVTRFRNGTNGLNVVPGVRDLYDTDIQILVRRSERGIFGRAFYIPTNAIALDEANAYCVVSVSGVTDGRFSFTHEVGHLQGAKHENDNRAPLAARGFLSGSATNAWRTLMTRTGAARCTLATSCRIGAFSSPTVTGPGGVPAGNANFNNAARVNATAVAIQNFRTVPNTLLLNNETIAANQVSNHLADNIIDSNNRTIVYAANSRSTMRAAQSIVLKPGVRISSGAQFRAYTISRACERVPLLNAAKLRGSSSFEATIPGTETEKNELKVFPNPAQTQLYIAYPYKMGHQYRIRIHNTTGQVVLEQPVDSVNDVLSIETIANGTYVLHLLSDNPDFQAKPTTIIVQK